MDDANAPDTLAALYHGSRSRGARLTPGRTSLGWGLLGASRIASQQMIPAIRQQPATPGAPNSAGSWVVSVFSHNERLAQQFAAQQQIPQADINLTDLLARREIHCVYVSSHPRQHAPLVLAALAAGKHVLCEPPLALSLEEAQAISTMATNRGLVVAVNYPARANPALQHLRQRLADGQIGDLIGGRVSYPTLLPVLQQTWRLQPGGGGVIWNHTIHDVDLVRMLLQDEIATVYATSTQQILSSRAHSPIVEDLIAQFTLTASRLTFQIHDSFLIGHQPALVELYGAHGTLLALHWPEAELRTELWLRQRDQLTQIPTPHIAPFWATVYSFHSAIRTGQAPFVSAEDGRCGVAVALALHKAVRERVPTPVLGLSPS